MSGKKRIYVDEGEWSRLQRQAGRLAELKRDLPALIDNVRTQTRADLDRTFQEFDARQRGVEQNLAGLSEQAATFERETSKRLRDNARQLRQQIEDSRRAVQGETREMLAEHRAEVDRVITAERHERERGMAELRTRVDEAQRDKDTAAELERRFLDDARVLHRAIAALPHERHQPGALDRLTRRLDDAEAVRGQVAAYGLGNAQSLYHEMSELRLHVEQQELAWRAAQGTAEQALRVVEELIRQQQTFVPAESASTKDLDVDYWSRGALSRLRGDVTELQKRIQDETQPMTVEELRDVAERQPELEQRLDAIIRQAGTAVFAAQLRTNFADVIATALEENHHYQVSESCFAGDDQRDAFYAKGTHLDGSEVVIEVKPADQLPECEVRILSYDEGTPSQEERAARTKSITASLRDYGIETTGAGEEPGEPDPATRDLAQVRRHPTVAADRRAATAK
jgi:hypothetical protein